MVFLKHSPLLLMCAFNWMYHMTSVTRRGGLAWDQATFGPLFDHCASSGFPGSLKIVMLNGVRFPNGCMGICGCNLTNVPDGQINNLPIWQMKNLPERLNVSEVCPVSLMEEWYGFHFACVSLERQGFLLKHKLMVHYLAMYEARIGSVGSRPSLTSLR